MWSKDAVNRAWITFPVTPSIAAAAIDRACTSSPTLVRSVNTGASHNCRIGRAGGPCSVTHESCEWGPGLQPQPELAPGSPSPSIDAPPTDGWDGVNVEHAQRSEHER